MVVFFNDTINVTKFVRLRYNKCIKKLCLGGTLWGLSVSKPSVERALLIAFFKRARFWCRVFFIVLDLLTVSSNF